MSTSIISRIIEQAFVIIMVTFLGGFALELAISTGSAWAYALTYVVGCFTLCHYLSDALGGK